MALARLAGEGRGGQWYRLARDLGGIARLWEAGSSVLREAGLSARAVAALERFDEWPRIERLRQRCRQLGITAVAVDEPSFPPLLREIQDPPLVLYVRGSVPVCSRRVVAVVGSRRPTRYGLRIARELAERLAEAGLVVASGLARGIDAAAHAGSLAAGPGIAVLAGGLDLVTPSCNRRLANRILDGGALVSEHPPGVPPLPGRFPVRNRIITGLAEATIVVEAHDPSGSLTSARHAAEQGREVFAVPGNIDSPASRGTNRLIAEGCHPLLDVRDVLEILGIDPGRVEQPQAVSKLEGDAALVAAALESEPCPVDLIVARSGVAASRVFEVLTQLELDGVAERLGGGMFALKAGVRLG